MLLAISLVILAYLLGSVSTGIIACRLAGLPDPRTQGSGNPGATNVLRAGSKKVAIITLLGDLLKGLVPVLLAKALGLDGLALAAVALAAFLGHLLPLYHQFKGGKGVATALGVLLGLSWMVGLLTLLTWLLAAGLSRISSVGALVAATAAPIYVAVMIGDAWVTGMSCVLALLIYWRHRGNLRRILAGEESRIGRF